jgi:murein DD-endopeptidase MepM/ murein hydrolase activator NlpD
MFPSKDKTIDFSYGAKYSTYSGTHKGVDFFVPIGTPVYAAVGGVVVHAGSNLTGGFSGRGWGLPYGVQVIVQNVNFKDGSPGLWAGYMHLSKVVVKPGQKIKKGQLLGYSGNTGRTKGPHLHFEIQKSRYWSSTGHLNPRKWLLA